MELILINFFYYLILVAILGYGFFFNRFFFSNIENYGNKNCDLGFIGLAGILFLILISYLTNIFFSHNEIFNLFLLLVGLFFFISYFRKYISQINFLLLTLIFLILSISFFLFKNHDDFAYYHFPFAYHLTQNKLIFGMGNFDHGWRTPSSLFYLNSLFYLPNIKYYLFHIAPVYILGFSNLIILKKIFSYRKKKLDFIFYLYFLTFIFINTFFSRLSEHGADLSGQVLALLMLLKILEIINFNEYQKKKYLEQVVLLLLITITLKTFFVLYLVFFIYISYLFYKKFFFLNTILNFKIISVSLLTFFFLVFSNFSSTGCLIYPVKFLCFENLSWAIKKNEVISASNWYELWSKAGASPDYRVTNPDYYIQDFNWIKNWFDKYFFNKVSDTLLGIFFICSIFFFLFFNAKERKKIKKIKFIYFLIIILLVEWFFKHPALRYGGYTLITLVIFIPISLYMHEFNNTFSSKYKIIIFLIVITFIYFIGKNFYRIHKEISKYNYSPLKKPFFFVGENYFRYQENLNFLVLKHESCKNKWQINCENLSPRLKYILGYKIFYKNK